MAATGVRTRVRALERQAQPKPAAWPVLIELPGGRYRDNASGRTYTDAEIAGRPACVIPDNGREVATDAEPTSAA